MSLASSSRLGLLFSALVLSLAACSVSVKDGAGGWPGQGGGSGIYPDGYKPEQSDFSGPIGDFAGTWTGDCRYIMDGDLRTDCTATLTVQMISQLGQSVLTGSLTYQIGSTKYPMAMIRPFIIDTAHNTMKNDSGATGRIGKEALQFLDGTFGGFSVKLLGSREIAVLASRLPLSSVASGFEADFSSKPQYDCSKDYCFSASLRR